MLDRALFKRFSFRTALLLLAVLACRFVEASPQANSGSRPAPSPAAPGSTSAASSVEEAPASSTENLQALLAQGESSLRAGNLDAAEQAFRKALVLNPQLAGAYANLGVIEMRRRHWEQALALLKKAQRLAPRVAGIRLNVGLVYFRQNNFNAAIAPLLSVVRDQPAASQPRYLLGLCYFFTDQAAQAVEMLEPLWEEQSKSLSYLYVVGNAAGQAGRKDLEQRALSQLTTSGENSPEFHLFMGKAHLNREEYEQA